MLTEDGVGRVLNQLKDQFDYIVCDSPAGIESGEHFPSSELRIFTAETNN